MTLENSKDASMMQYIEACQASISTQAAYCKQHDLPSHIFSYYWKKLGYVTSSKAVRSKNQLITVNLQATPPHKFRNIKNNPYQ